MNEQQSETNAGQCFCRGAGPRITQRFRMRSDAARQHLTNARVEFLKAVRTLIDERIAYLTRSEQKGSSVNVE